MSKILLLSDKKDFVKKASVLLAQNGHKVVKEISAEQLQDINALKKFGLLIIDQNYPLNDHTPLIILLAHQIKTNMEYPPIILIVPENFKNHVFYPEVDIYITSNLNDNDFTETVENGIASRQYLKGDSQYHHRSSFEELQDFFNRELTVRDRELSSVTMLLMKKNSQLYHIYSYLDTMKESNFLENLSYLKNRVRQFIDEDERVESFFSYFNKTQPEFIAKLDAMAKLTLTERKHCACLKMGLENKQIAALFSIDHQSVKKAHTRLKKKLGLNDERSLRDFISTI
jgi:DNA-binding NarL/FixJ family response regulator